MLATDTPVCHQRRRLIAAFTELFSSGPASNDTVYQASWCPGKATTKWSEFESNLRSETVPTLTWSGHRLVLGNPIDRPAEFIQFAVGSNLDEYCLLDRFLIWPKWFSQMIWHWTDLNQFMETSNLAQWVQENPTSWELYFRFGLISSF